MGRFIMRANGTMNPKIVGRSAQTIAEMAKITIPEGTRVLVSFQTTVGKDNPYSREKLCPILAFYVEENWEDACKRSIEILNNEGAGHTMTIHSEDLSVIREFALKKPVSRLLVNTIGSLGGVGGRHRPPARPDPGLRRRGGAAPPPDNVGPMNLINIRRVAFGLKELDEIRGAIRPRSLLLRPPPPPVCKHHGHGKRPWLPEPGRHRGHHQGRAGPAGTLILFLDAILSSRNPCAAHTRIVRWHAAPSHAELGGLRPIKTF